MAGIQIDIGLIDIEDGYSGPLFAEHLLNGRKLLALAGVAQTQGRAGSTISTETETIRRPARREICVVCSC